MRGDLGRGGELGEGGVRGGGREDLGGGLGGGGDWGMCGWGCREGKLHTVKKRIIYFRSEKKL